MAKEKIFVSVSISKQLWKKNQKRDGKNIHTGKTQLAIFIIECNELELSTCGRYKNTEK